MKTIRNFHAGEISFLKYLSNGYVASASSDNTVNVWDPNTFKTIRRYTGHQSYVNCLDEIDKDTIVSGSDDETIHVWTLSMGEATQIIYISGASVNTLTVLSNGYQHIVCGLNTMSENLQIYDYVTGDLVKSLSNHSMGIYSITILSDQFMATGSADAYVIIWDLATYNVKFKLSLSSSKIYCVKRLSSNLIASAHSTGEIFVWDWLKGTHVFTLTGHTDKIYLALDLFDEQTLISGSKDKTIKFWNISRGELIQTVNVDIPIYTLTMLKMSKSNFFNANRFQYLNQSKSVRSTVSHL